MLMKVRSQTAYDLNIWGLKELQGQALARQDPCTELRGYTTVIGAIFDMIYVGWFRIEALTKNSEYDKKCNRN